MEYIVILNGLGNQMSQYAFYLKKKKQNNKVKCIINSNEHNGFELNKLFNLNLSFHLFPYILFRILATKKLGFISGSLRKIFSKLGVVIIDENYDYSYRPELLKKRNSLVTIYLGGWHNARFYKNMENELSEVFQFPKINDEENLQIIKIIENCNSVSVHIRRGDYLKDNNYKMFGGICDEKYYMSAFRKIKEKIKNPTFFIFSDDIEWSKEHICKDENCYFVNINKKTDSWKDMFLMSICKHNIIANSTFSWWGAYLNKNEKAVVIAPSIFIKTDLNSDIYKDDWIKIPYYNS